MRGALIRRCEGAGATSELALFGSGTTNHRDSKDHTLTLGKNITSERSSSAHRQHEDSLPSILDHEHIEWMNVLLWQSSSSLMAE